MGDTLDLVAAGIVVFVLLLASYSTRKTWIALGSMAVSIMLLAGAVFLFTAQDADKIRSGFATLAKKLPEGWEQPARDITAAIEQVSTAVADAVRTSTKELGTVRENLQAASTSGWFSTTSEPQVAPPVEAETEPAPILAVSPPPGATITWRLEPPAGGETFELGGTNVSGHTLEKVRAILKPESDADKLELTLQVEGQTDGAKIIPPGATFSLVAPTLTGDEAARFGGAILSLAYAEEGQRKKAIMYLAPPLLGKIATRE